MSPAGLSAGSGDPLAAAISGSPSDCDRTILRVATSTATTTSPSETLTKTCDPSLESARPSGLGPIETVSRTWCDETSITLTWDPPKPEAQS